MIRTFVVRLYDQRKNCQTSHHDMNKLRVKVATSRDASFVRLSPSDAALKQHSLRTSLQIKIWTVSHVAKLHIPIFHHHKNTDGKMERIRYNGYTLKDRFQQTLCKILYVREGKSPCKKSWVCFEENLACAD